MWPSRGIGGPFCLLTPLQTVIQIKTYLFSVDVRVAGLEQHFSYSGTEGTATDELAERSVVLVAVLVTGGSSDRGRGLRLKDRTGEILCEVSPSVICRIYSK